MKKRDFILKIEVLVATIAIAFGIFTVLTSKVNASSYKDDLINKDQLTIGLEGTYKPYSYRSNGKLTGFEVDLGKALAKQMGVKVKFVPTKWDSLIAGVGASKYDIVLNNITQTPERKKVYIFSNPYIYSRYTVISSKKNKINNLKEIKNKKFAEGTGTNNEILAKKYKAKIVSSGDFATSLSLIRQGRVQGTINAAEAYYAYAKTNKVSDLHFKDLSKQVKPVKISALLNKKNKKLQKRINKALKTLKDNGTLKKLSEKYFGSDITKKP
ncbi:transporter substrate-binding domain-containing protein [Liquorilactobacillus mali]|uniref:Amino acid ABC transporter substrate-binding protein n=1 Tax=Liquorilactobacillus mali KCTC 3596 = DSM 20444 TaxID=1046596 RepID=J0L6I5_9LACO|nr:transporter substrate-binding domain-containing protein [Liquorilactobacillus mali]EJF00533.1 amino acid ABC transporter substrate-binding protein [Liquorilactobacillus mali KCTC 3596 = DSM 20444]KRN09714.1 amino acid ABC transporter substrate-binding protein [Liquorilactobacillus mali KCTC 3596 = DSM 20444]QFQ74004.1 transporter substrate-binding domain-containing protein [Liquorilactobacillus mali]